MFFPINVKHERDTRPIKLQIRRDISSAQAAPRPLPNCLDFAPSSFRVNLRRRRSLQSLRRGYCATPFPISAPGYAVPSTKEAKDGAEAESSREEDARGCFGEEEVCAFRFSVFFLHSEFAVGLVRGA